MRNLHMTISAALVLCLSLSTGQGCSNKGKSDSSASVDPSSAKETSQKSTSSSKSTASSEEDDSAVVISTDPNDLPDDLQLASEPILIRHRLDESTKLRYLIRSSTIATSSIGGRLEESEGTNLRIESVGPADGDRVPMSAIFEDLAMRLTSPTVDFQFDSRTNEVPPGPLGQMLGPVLKNITAGPITFTLSPTGTTENVMFPTAFQEAIAANETLAEVGISEKTFEQMVRSALVPLPEQAVKSGDQWKHSEAETAFGPAISFEADYQFEGTIESEDGQNWAVISFAGETSGSGDSGTAIESVKVTTTGQLYFDIEQGRVTRLASLSTGSVTTNVGGQKAVQAVVGNTTVKLLK